MQRAAPYKCYFSSHLKIPYEKSFINTATDMIKSLAKITGANEREIFHLTMLVEDSLVFIIDKYIDDKLKAHIEIGYLLFEDNRVVLEFSDQGSPIHKDKIPEFKVDNDDSVDGLWLHMVKQISDNFEIINRFNAGWVIRIEKSIGNISFEADAVCCADNGAISKSKPLIRLATEEDADGLLDLAYMTYRYSNAIPEFYDVEQLKGHIEDKLYDIVVAYVDDRLIGATSFKYNGTDSKFAEMSGAMVHPDYRKTMVAMYMLREISKYHKDNPRGIDFFVSYLVTTHTRSQKAVERIHNSYCPLSISLNMIPAPDYIGIKHEAVRETQLNSYHLNKPLEAAVLYAPSEHSEIINELIANTGNSIGVTTEPSSLLVGSSEIESVSYNFALSAILTIKKLGEDWFHVLCRRMLELTSSGCRTVVVNVASGKPLPSDFNEKLGDLGMFFCGLNLRSLSDIQLSYTFVSDKVDFNLIELHHPLAKKLLLYIEEGYSKTH